MEEDTYKPEGEGMNPTDAEEAQAEEQEETVSISKAEYERLQKAEDIRKQQAARLKKAKEAHDEPKTNSEDIILARLEARGVLEEDDQAFVRKVMEREGLTLQQAMADEYVKDKLARNKNKRESDSAIPAPSKRTGNGGKDLDYYVKHPKELAPTPEMRREVMKTLARKPFGF
jgi:hypothetical protein